MKCRGIVGCFRSVHDQEGSSNRLSFRGNSECFVKNGELLLTERITLFNGRTNPIRCFSVANLNSMDVFPLVFGVRFDLCKGNWNGVAVLIKMFHVSDVACREIAIATQMGIHGNVLRLLGSCLDTNCPALVYEWPENGTLGDRLHRYKEQCNEPLEWKRRLHIAWEVAHAVSYLHTAFSRPIIHRDLNPSNIYLDQDGSARLSDFSLSISIPVGETHADLIDSKVCGGTLGYVAPEYYLCGKMSESSDVYSFGVFLLVLMTGKYTSDMDRDEVYIVDWVSNYGVANCVTDIVDPAITTNDAVVMEHVGPHLKALVELGLRCSAQGEESRPTMVEAATQLKNMITSLSDSL
ncbi:hypothetical protein vseg_008946 [Gypsophila vaccaria]